MFSRISKSSWQGYNHLMLGGQQNRAEISGKDINKNIYSKL